MKWTTRLNRFNVALAGWILNIVGSMVFFYLTTAFNIIGLATQPWQPELIVLNISNAFQLQLVSLTLFASARSENRQRRNEAEIKKNIRQLCSELLAEEKGAGNLHGNRSEPTPR